VFPSCFVPVAITVTVVVAVVVEITSCASSVVRYLSLLMCLSCVGFVVTQLSTLARV
jgi:hypothetical protein